MHYCINDNTKPDSAVREQLKAAAPKAPPGARKLGSSGGSKGKAGSGGKGGTKKGGARKARGVATFSDCGPSG